MTDLTARVFAGEINPGQLQIVREILPLTVGGPDFDTAVFSDVLANYLINGQPFDPNNPPTPDPTGSTPFRTSSAASLARTGPIVCPISSGCSSADQAIVLGGLNNAPVGLADDRDERRHEDQTADRVDRRRDRCGQPR